MTVVETPPSEAFQLSESVALEETVFNDDGTITIHALRPCLGKGKGRHLYEAPMLRENAPNFANWRMFTNHLSESAKRALEGLPRPIEHLGGRVVDSWWDEDVPADPEKGYGQGAVVAKVKPVGVAKKLIEEDPELIEASINAQATAVRPITYKGARAWLVEGIEEEGSIDWVTEGGAGGRVASLVESVYHTQKDVDMALLESLTDEELVASLKKERPGLVEALVKPEEQPREEETPKPKEEETIVSETTPKPPVEALREALETEEGRELVHGLFDTRLQEALTAEREMGRVEARAIAERGNSLRDMRDAAHSLIESAKLPQKFEEELKRRYALTEDGPTDALDVIDEINDEGEVVKTAAQQLRESVETEIKRQRELVEAANPTRVRRQGPVSDERELQEGDGGEETAPAKPSKKNSSLWQRTLQESGVDPNEAYE